MKPPSRQPSEPQPQAPPANTANEYDGGHSSVLQKQSVRWLNLSTTLWTLVVMDAERIVDRAGLADFLQVMHWRAHGKVSGAEFTALYNEWIGRSLAYNVRIDAYKKKTGTLGLAQMRMLLLDACCAESDLDLFVGMIVHETNVNFLNTPISYLTASSKHPRLPASEQASANLEVCTKRWIDLSEELFFCLDTPGYGELRFDELFFLSGCLATGLQGWRTEADAEADLSLGVLTATTLQLMREAGATISLTSHRQELLALSRGVGESEISKDSFGVGSAFSNSVLVPSPQLQYFNHALHAVSLPMFKLFLMKRGVGDAALSSLVVHVKTCVERMARITLAHADDLYTASKPLENQRNIGSPRLWQHAVCLALGYDPSVYERFVTVAGGSTVQHPPALLILLSDAERLIPGVLRAIESPIDLSQAADYYRNTANVSHSMLNNANKRGTLAPAEELQETAHRLWAAFRVWGSPYTYRGVDVSAAAGSGFTGSYSLDRLSGPAGGTNVTMASLGIDGIQDVQRDPVYQLVLMALAEYKILQIRLCAAFFDLAMAHYGIGGAANAIGVACAAVIPSAEAMILELGLDEAPPHAAVQAPRGPAKEELHSPAHTPHASLSFQSAPANHPQVSLSFEPASPVTTSLYLQLDGGAHREGTAAAPPAQAEPRAQWKTMFESRPPSKRASMPPMTTPLATDAALQRAAPKRPLTPEKEESVQESKAAPPHPQSPPAQPKQLEIIADLSVTESQLLHLLLETTDKEQRENIIERLRGYKTVLKASTATERQALAAATPVREDAPSAAAPVKGSSSGSPPAKKVFTVLARGAAPLRQTKSSRGESRPPPAPHSLTELLEHDQSAGQYAQTLREILRTMSQDGSKVQLKSLEMILALGENIVNNERNSINDLKERHDHVPAARQASPPPEATPRYALPRSSASPELAGRARLADVPGKTPSSAIKSKPTRVFGHPL